MIQGYYNLKNNLMSLHLNLSNVQSCFNSLSLKISVPSTKSILKKIY